MLSQVGFLTVLYTMISEMMEIRGNRFSSQSLEGKTKKLGAIQKILLQSFIVQPSFKTVRSLTELIEYISLEVKPISSRNLISTVLESS